MSFNYKKLLQREVNVGLKEQKARYTAGSILLIASPFFWHIPLLLLAVAMLATAKTRWCPAYSAMEKNTMVEGEESEAGNTPVAN